MPWALIKTPEGNEIENEQFTESELIAISDALKRVIDANAEDVEDYWRAWRKLAFYVPRQPKKETACR